MIRTFALFTLIVLAGCASDPPSVGVIHTVPPKFNIVPAKTLAVIGAATNAEERENEDPFIGLILSYLSRHKEYDVKDERELAYGINKGNGFGQQKDWQKYLDETAGDVIVVVGVPKEDCESHEITGYGWDDILGWSAECREKLALFKPHTGERIGNVNADGHGYENNQESALASALGDAADQIIGGFAPQQSSDLILLDEAAPLVHEGNKKFDNSDYPGVRWLWENALTTFPNSAPLLYNLGALCEALHDTEAARAYYSKAIAVAPQVQRYQAALAQLELRQADAVKAVANPAEEDTRKNVAAEDRAVQTAASVVSKSGIRYLPIPAGTFTMGCTKGDIDCKENETPAHAVTISKSFYMAQTPVTNEQYQRCIAARVCHGKADLTNQFNPVVKVTWNDARNFCTWAGGRLPSEAEWEYAARGGVEGWRFPWGNSAGEENANFANNADSRIELFDREHTDAAIRHPFDGTIPVGSFKPNGFGLDDMTGVVSQWTADWTNDYPTAAVTDPTGPATGEKHVVRGGSWADPGTGARISARYSAEPGYSQETVGFRCAMDR